ncbi:hypothetical protein NOJ28_19745 [Neorhizobium galegae]|uniref:hypothetical protein n=1 Tax=Neorhizobium galegae TaxID=399 RepID=UPI0021053772|nr:hypothetical protein [Neorhizobium galegae]MCQ1767782.1 hypothetical protein [Neorhizobium galegae]MCQ1848121.1 hypothetical protein [Neorhizobium galegae]
MAVFAVRDEEDIWGASAALIRHLLNYSIGLVGHRPYILQVKNMFDWGYNSFRLFELPKAEFLEFAELVDAYRKSGAYLDTGYLPSEVEPLIDNLLNRLRAAAHHRQLH